MPVETIAGTHTLAPMELVEAPEPVDEAGVRHEALVQ